ncbi:MAG: spore coat polysaccharide biosynthesis protein SpsL [Parcubacteria group bacterium Gr01-1014_8]|nr:MAG: spore coat polysaccharide biosynthesis protein SpsL [Parcubacteria group bacterium Gr01-1014_8]
MIDGVHIKNIVRHNDERGYFAELMKKGEPGYHEIAQTSYALTLPGVIKAFHFHDYSETWVVVRGSAQIVMYDGRENSKTKGETQVIEAGEENPIVLSIPPRVAHGYRVRGDEPVGMLYHAGEAYDAGRKDQIGTIPFNSPDINFDWNS